MNIAWKIYHVSQKFPEKKSVILARDHSFFTFREFEERSSQIAHRLRRLGIRPGMRTLLFVKPCLDFSVITFALFKIGAVPVLIDPGMGLPNLLNSVRQVKPEALISVGAVHWLRRFRPSFFHSVKIKVSLGRVFGGTHYLYQGLEGELKTFQPLEVSSDTTAAILFTSGGTGIPKGVLYTHGILNFQTECLKEMFKLSEKNTDLPGFPLFALFTLAMGMTSVIPQMDPTRPSACDPKKIVQDIQDFEVTFVAGSPAIWERVGRYCLSKNIQLPHVQQVVMFGAPVRPEIHQMFKKILLSGDTFTPYGATECLPVSLISGSEILQEHLPLMLTGFGTCIGRPVPSTEIKILKTSDIPEADLVEVPRGEIGEIAVKGPQVTSGYFEMTEETQKSKIYQGNELWHRMGDLGRIDEHNNLWFLGRKAHRVVCENVTYYPLQVEAIFNQHPEIRRSALVKVQKNGQSYPALVIERYDGKTQFATKFLHELEELSESTPFTKAILSFHLHPSFPVDVRHNIKIDQLKLSHWVQQHWYGEA